MINDKTVLEDDRELKGWLLVLNGQWKGRDYRLFAGKTVIGSSHYADIYLPDDRLEPFHFSIRFTNATAWITDLDSNTGLFIENQPVFKEHIVDETLFNTAGMEFLVKFIEDESMPTTI